MPSRRNYAMPWRFFFFSSRRRHTRLVSDWSSDVCSSDLTGLTGRTVGEIRSLVASGEASAVEVCQAHLERARALEPRLKAFRALLKEEALREAARVDRERADGRPPGPLAGVPIAVKDVLCVRGAPATCGSRILESHVPIYDATCVARLRGAG